MFLLWVPIRFGELVEMYIFSVGLYYICVCVILVENGLGKGRFWICPRPSASLFSEGWRGIPRERFKSWRTLVWWADSNIVGLHGCSTVLVFTAWARRSSYMCLLLAFFFQLFDLVLCGMSLVARNLVSLVLLNKWGLALALSNRSSNHIWGEKLNWL